MNIPTDTPASNSQHRSLIVGLDDGRQKSNCQSCGERVSRQFRRVFGDNDGHVWACLDCRTNH